MVKRIKERRFEVEPLPPFASPYAALRMALGAFNPPSRETVLEIAPRRKIEAGGSWVDWRPDVAPYMNEPMEQVTSRRFDSIAFVGPARCSKSEALVMNPIAHAILSDPRKVAVFSASRDTAREWSDGALSDFIDYSPELSALLGKRQGDDNQFSKRFRGGMRLTVDYPVKKRLMQRSLDLVVGTDYDAFPEDVEGDGEAFPLMRKRTESAGSRAMTIVESSPRYTILDETWSPKSPHEAPPTGGILGIYNTGSRGRLYWRCPDCGDVFEPRFERLRYPDEGTPAERGAAAEMACPHCGVCIAHSAKRGLNQGAVWLHEEATGALVPLHQLKRLVNTVSYWLPGPAAALASWANIVSRYLEAEEVFQRTEDEAGLKTVMNVELGLPYLPRAGLSGVSLEETALRNAATDHKWQTCPAGTAFVTAAVDVQAGRFVVQVEAWQHNLERVVIDRFDLVNPPATAPRPEGRRIDPARYAEDWLALDGIGGKAYPVAGQEYGLRPVAVMMDMGGEAGVTSRAYSYWRRMRLRAPNQYHIVRGTGRKDAPRIKVAAPESAARGKKHAAKDVQIIWVHGDTLKGEVAAALSREDNGASKLHLSRFAPPEIYGEYAAERLTKDGWRKRPGMTRNEALDLSVYNLAGAIAIGAEKIAEAPTVPTWAIIGPDNTMARPIGSPKPAADGAGTHPTDATDPAPRKRSRVRRAKSKGW